MTALMLAPPKIDEATELGIELERKRASLNKRNEKK